MRGVAQHRAYTSPSYVTKEMKVMDPILKELSPLESFYNK